MNINKQFYLICINDQIYFKYLKNICNSCNLHKLKIYTNNSKTVSRIFQTVTKFLKYYIRIKI